MTDRTLIVWWGQARVGDLVQDRHGDLSFAYATDWIDQGDARPLSRSLPLRVERFYRRECRPFFGGLLPDEDQRIGAAAALGVSPANDFALLDRLGGDIAGALTLLPDGEIPIPPIAATPEPMSDDTFAALLDRLPRTPLLAGTEGLRMSLAGAQPKLPVVLVDGRPALPAAGQATTHIVKPENPRFPGSVANEAWCMRLAGQVGLDVAPANVRMAADTSYLLVTRYDRATHDGIVTRLHQEDCCQALGIAADRKYASEGGPAFRDLFALIRDYVRVPAIDVLKMVDAAIVNLSIGNADAHGKNFSFLLDARGPRLAPLYDLLSTIAWPGFDHRSAMQLGRAGTIDELGATAWRRFAADAGITEPFLRRRVEALTRRIEAICARDEAGEIAARTGARAALIRQSLG